MGAQRRYKGEEGICRRVRGYMGVQRRYKEVQGICRGVQGYIGVQRRYKGVEGRCRRVQGYMGVQRRYKGWDYMGCVKRHGNGSYGNSKRISMRKLYKEVLERVERR